MACHVIGQRRSPFLAEGMYRVRPRKSTGSLFSLVSWPAAAKEAVDCRRAVLCCTAAPTAPREEAIKSGNGMAEIGRCLLSVSTRADGVGVKKENADGEATTRTASAESLDRWVRESVTDIVQNIQDAPFLVCLYSSTKGAAMRLERELVGAEERNWSKMKSSLREKGPDGIILVEELKEINKEAEDSTSKCSKLWGLLIQGKGIDIGACYILKTTRICSALGLCTHFCLIRAQCYGDTAEVQLRNSWLNMEF
ncbi:uncharacterized protein LOC116254027 [Nymphaea colorata]|nr:uncharacterized protein LOC116254027 [Nymphaea colorata]